MSGSTTQHTETTGRPQPTRNTGQKIAYAFGNLGQAAFYNTMSTFFITFVTTALFIDVDKTLAKRLIAVITGLVVVIRIAEIFLDPLLGNLVDNTNTRWGRFRPWQFIGGIVPGILLIMVFTGLFGLVDVNTGVFMVLFVIVFILLDVIYSLRDISYWGMIPAISSDSHERSTYTALGAFTGSIGYNGVTVIVVPVVSWFTWKFTGQWEQGRTGWAAFAIIIAVLGLLTAWSVAFGTRENQGGLRAKAEANGNPIEAFKAIAQNDQLLWVALSYLLYSVANVATTGVLFYQFKYVLGAPDSFSIAGIIPVITGLGTTPLYPVLNRRIPRRWLYTAGMALMIAGYTLFIIAPMNLPVVIVALVLFYLPAQTIQMTAILSMTDSIEYGQLKNGKRNEARHPLRAPDARQDRWRPVQRHRGLRGRAPEWSATPPPPTDHREHPHVQDLRLLPAARRHRRQPRRLPPDRQDRREHARPHRRTARRTTRLRGSRQAVGSS